MIARLCFSAFFNLLSEEVLLILLMQVRSLTLDVKVWEPSVLTLFQSLGNTFVNSVWEETLYSKSTLQADTMPIG